VGDSGGEVTGSENDGVGAGAPPGTANASSNASAFDNLGPPKLLSKEIPSGSADELMFDGD
jgi:hypothetical protein